MASWVGTAKTLLGLKDQWQGTLMFIAQPAEETVSGAKAMLADGLFTRFPKPDFGFALHDGASPMACQLSRRAGSSNADSLEITFHGHGGHGARPQRTIDPVMMAARFIVDVQSVISREKDPTEFGVVSIGAIHGGTAENIIPDNVLLLRNHPHLQAGGARQNARRDRANGKGRRRDVGCARARRQDHRRHQGRDQRSRRGRDGRKKR